MKSDDSPRVEVGHGVAKGSNSFAVGAQAARQALDGVGTCPISTVLVFASVHYDLEEMLSGIHEVVGNVPVFGATTAGEICNGTHEKSVVAIIIASPYLRVRIGIGREVSQDWRSSVRQAVCSPSVIDFFSPDERSVWDEMTRHGESAFGMLFSPGNTSHADSRSHEILQELRHLSQARLPIFGGCAADDWGMEANYVLYGKRAYADSIVIAVFQTSLRFGITMSHGFAPTARSATVTKARGHEVIELNGRPACDMYADLLEVSVESLQGKHLTLSTGKPLGVNDPFGQHSINVPSYFTSEGGIRLAQPVSEGTELMVMEPCMDKMLAAGKKAFLKCLLRSGVSEPAVILVCSCALRSRILKERTAEEISQMMEVTREAPLAGFYSFGEQGISDDGENRDNNEVVTVLVLGRELSYAALVAQENIHLREELAAKVVALGQTATALRESEARFSLFMNHFPGLTYVKDYRGRTLFASKGFLKYLGIEPSTAIGKTNHDLFPADFADKITADDRRVLKSGASEEIEEPFGGHVWSTIKFPIPRPGKATLLGGFTRDITERKKAEEALRASEALYHLLVETSQDLIWRCDSEGRYVYLNPAWEDTFGYKLEDMLGKPFTAFQSSEYAERDLQVFGRLMQDGSVKGFETVHLHESGREIHLVFNAKAVKDDRGRIIGTLGTAYDITERKNAEEALREREKKYLTLFQGSNDAIFMHDLEGNIVGGNRRAQEMFGYSEQEILSLKVTDLHPEEALQVSREQFENIVRDGDIFFEVDFVKKNGQVFSAEVSSSLFEHSGRKMVQGIIRDITARKKADEALQKEREMFQDILEATLAGYWDWDIAGNTEYLSPTFKKMFGYEDHELPNLPETWQTLISQEDLPGVLEVFDKHVKSRGKTPYYNEVRYRHKDGSTIWVICAGRVVEWDSAGNPLRMVGCHVNITERKRAEEERERLLVELKQTVAEVKKLSGLLPICASCKKIRDDKGYWQQIEAFISDHSEADFTHGICPECGKKLYGEFWEDEPGQ